MEKSDSRQDHGLIIEKPQADHYMLGGLGNIPLTPFRPDGNWKDSLPKEEPQSHEGLETYNCTGYGTLHAIAIFMKAVFGPPTDPDLQGDYDWSERFEGVMAGTTQNGNSPHTAAESVRNYGLLDAMYLPFSPAINSWDGYYAPKPMTPEYLSKAAKSLEQYDLSRFHDWAIDGTETPEVKASKLLEALKASPLGVAVYAWRQDPATGYYIRPPGASSSHWVALINAVENKYWEIFDTYPPFIKKLDWNHLATTEMAKRYYIKKKDAPPPLIEEEEPAPVPAPAKKSWWQILIELLNKIFGIK